MSTTILLDKITAVNAKKMKLDFEYLKKEILATNVKSEYKQSSIIILRNIFKEAETKQLPIHGVGSSLPKVCTGCGSLSTKVIDKKYLACCPDNNYIPMEDYCKKAIYPDKQF